MKRYKIKNRLRFFIALSLLITISVLSTFTLVVSAKNNTDPMLMTEYVEQGDTLWGLSKLHNEKGIDIRDYINKVIEVNNLQGANIKPGDMLYFPVSD